VCAEGRQDEGPDDTFRLHRMHMLYSMQQGCTHLTGLATLGAVAADWLHCSTLGGFLRPLGVDQRAAGGAGSSQHPEHCEPPIHPQFNLTRCMIYPIIPVSTLPQPPLPTVRRPAVLVAPLCTPPTTRTPHCSVRAPQSAVSAAPCASAYLASCQLHHVARRGPLTYSECMCSS
jgi:hypothetical protein